MTGNRYIGRLPSMPEHELLLLWIMAPAGLDGLFRETNNPPGVSRKTREQIHEIGRKAFTQAYFLMLLMSQMGRAALSAMKRIFGLCDAIHKRAILLVPCFQATSDRVETRHETSEKHALRTCRLVGGSFRILSDCFFGKGTRLVLYQPPAGLPQSGTGHGRQRLALRLLLASAERELGL